VASVLRQDVTLQGELAAWLWHPEGATGAVVLGHGLSAVRDQRLPAYAERFAAAGLAVLLFDYRHFGASAGEPRQLLDIQRQLEDWRTALAYARGLDGVERVGLFGSSFGGGHALTIATESPAVQAVVAQCPMTDGLKASLMTPKLTALKLGKVALQDLIGSYFGRRPKLIPAAGKPGELALMSAPDALPGMRSITPAESAWVNLVAARVALKIGLYRPGARASRIECPLLICVCDKDSLVDAEAAEKVAHDAPQGEVAHYPIGHFDIYTGEWFERAVSRQTEFLARHLGAP
jgi:dienelactone hydrolase